MSLFAMRAPTSPALSKLLHLVDYATVGLWEDLGDPRVSNYAFFGNGPFTTLTILAVYLYFVLNFGPRFMKNREPYSLKTFTQLYNVAMVLLNGWVFVEGMQVTKFGTDCWGCRLVDYNSKDPRELRKLFLGHWFFMSKLIELADTIIFVLRKKYNQVSFLHVVHHSLVPLLIWIGFKLSPGGNMSLFPLLNSLIHTAMYSYYLLSTFGPQVRRHLWWKPYLTKVQMVQFVVVIVHALHVLFLPGCAFPKVLLYLSMGNALLFLVLFYSFYLATYGKGRKQQAIEREEKLQTANNNSKKKL